MGDEILKKILPKNEKLPWELNSDDERKTFWEKQVSENGFDDRQIWSLNSTIIYLLYPRLLRYKEVAENEIDLSYHKIKIRRKTKTFGEWIAEILKIWEAWIKNETPFYDVKSIKYSFEILKNIFDLLWW